MLRVRRADGAISISGVAFSVRLTRVGVTGRRTPIKQSNSLSRSSAKLTETPLNWRTPYGTGSGDLALNCEWFVG